MIFFAFVALLIITLAAVGQNAFLQVRHAHERKAWDTERRIYISSVLGSETPGASRAILKPPAERPQPKENRPVPIDG